MTVTGLGQGAAPGQSAAKEDDEPVELIAARKASSELLGRGSQLRTERGEERQGPIPRFDACCPVSSEGKNADAEVGDSRVTEGAQASENCRLVTRCEDVAHVGGISSVEQLLVVRAELGVPEHAVRASPRIIH